MLKNVKRVNGVFEAIDEMGRYVYIAESISFLFQVNGDEERVMYKPLYYRDADILEEIELFLVGNKRANLEIIETIVVRFGWMDSRLNKLSFMSLTELMTLVQTKKATATQKRKLTAICKQLGISLKLVNK